MKYLTISNLDPEHLSALHLAVGEVGALQQTPGKVRPTQIRPAQVGVFEVYVTEVQSFKPISNINTICIQDTG